MPRVPAAPEGTLALLRAPGKGESCAGVARRIAAASCPPQKARRTKSKAGNSHGCEQSRNLQAVLCEATLPWFHSLQAVLDLKLGERPLGTEHEFWVTTAMLTDTQRQNGELLKSPGTPVASFLPATLFSACVQELWPR